MDIIHASKDCNNRYKAAVIWDDTQNTNHSGKGTD